MTAPSRTRIEAATEAFYALLPAHIRSVDAAGGGALKALVAILAGGAAEIDGEIDALHDSMFVDTASEEALADLAALVAAEPLAPLPPGAGHNLRAYVANTIRYRRGKGTARVLEALAADVGGFGAIAVEYFMRLARTQHLLDVRPERPGTAPVRPGETAARTATAFDRLPRLADLRSIARAAGRHHVPHVGVHLLRPVAPAFPAPPGDGLAAADLDGVPAATAWRPGGTARAGYFQLAAQEERVLRLFNPDRRAEAEGARAAETDLRDRLKRLPLHLETEALRRAAVEGGAAPAPAAPWFDAAGQPFTLFLRAAGETSFRRVPPDEILIANLETAPTPAGARPAATRGYTWFEGAVPTPLAKSGSRPIACGFDPVTGRLIAAAPAAGYPDVEEVRIAYAYGIGREIGAGPQDRNDADVPFDITDTDALTHFVRLVDATRSETGAAGDALRTVQTLAKALAEWGASGAGRRGLIVLLRCDREAALAPATRIDVPVHPGSELHVVSGQWRPKRVVAGLPDNPDRLGYLVRKDRRFTVATQLRVIAAAAPPAGGEAGVLVLDGIEVTGGVSLAVRAVSELRIRHCTIRAPGAAALDTTAALEGMAIRIERSVIGRIRLDYGVGPATGSLRLSGSLVSLDEAPAPAAAIAAADLDAEIEDTTILGESRFKSLEATNVIFAGPAIVTRTQAGCVRYSAVEPGSTLPRRYRCQPDLALAAAAEKKGGPLGAQERIAVALGVRPIFLDTALDEPTAAMLHPMTDDAIRAGGEGDCEMGVFAEAAERLRMRNIESLFDDFLPFGLEAGLIDDTRSGAVARRRNLP